MEIPKQNIREAFTFIVVPEAFVFGPTAIGMPYPVALDNLIRGADGDFRTLHGLAVVGGDGRVDVAGDTFSAGEIGCPLHEVAISELNVAVGSSDVTDAV